MFNFIKTNMKYSSDSPITNFNVGELRNICHILMDYCKDNIGYHKTKGLPSFSIRKSPTRKYLGQFYPDNHLIKIYYNHVGTLGEFVKTFVHEYTHSTQNLRHYENRLLKYGYTNHPEEIEARLMEGIHFDTIMIYLKKNIK